jgi:hypothetical protein
MRIPPPGQGAVSVRGAASGRRPFVAVPGQHRRTDLHEGLAERRERQADARDERAAGEYGHDRPELVP